MQEFARHFNCLQLRIHLITAVASNQISFYIYFKTVYSICQILNSIVFVSSAVQLAMCFITAFTLVKINCCYVKLRMIVNCYLNLRHISTSKPVHSGRLQYYAICPVSVYATQWRHSPCHHCHNLHLILHIFT